MAIPILPVLADIADVGYDAVLVVIDDVVDAGVGVIPK
jgi:hypothetical protein